MTEAVDSNLRVARRVRHDLKFRRLEVASVEDVTPTLKRIVLTGPELEGFFSPGFDDHAKIFPVKRGVELTLPTLGPDGPVWPEGAARPTARDYTPRRYDAKAGQLIIDFATGHGGPATEWAEAAQVGDVLGIGGPRGSFLITTAYDSHMLVGDETAIPAISRRLEELPAGAQAVVVIEVDNADCEPPLETRADLSVRFVHRNGRRRGEAEALTAAALEAASLIRSADMHIWVACESGVARSLRGELVKKTGVGAKSIKAAGYWRRGAASVHEVHDG